MSAEGDFFEGLSWENDFWGLLDSDNSGGGAGRTLNSEMQKEPMEAEPLASGPAALSDDQPGENVKPDGDVKEGKAGRDQSAARLAHIRSERERRKKMKSMFSDLHALLPQLPPKADKSSIVEEAVNSIKTLEKTLQQLEKQKQERLQVPAGLGYAPCVMTTQKLALNPREAIFLANQGSSSNLQAAAMCAPAVSSYPFSVPLQPVGFQTWASDNVVLNICGDEAHISICSQKKQGLFTNICWVLEKYRIEIISAQVSSESNCRRYLIQTRANAAGGQWARMIFPVEEIYKQAVAEISMLVSS